MPVPDIGNLNFPNVFEYYVRVFNMVPIGVYKKIEGEQKSYVWLHPSREVRLIENQDELFVLSDRNPKDSVGLQRNDVDNSKGKRQKNEEKKVQKENLRHLEEIHLKLQDLLSSFKELHNEIKKTDKDIEDDLAEKIKSDLYTENQ